MAVLPHLSSQADVADDEILYMHVYLDEDDTLLRAKALPGKRPKVPGNFLMSSKVESDGTVRRYNLCENARGAHTSICWPSSDAELCRLLNARSLHDSVRRSIASTRSVPNVRVGGGGGGGGDDSSSSLFLTFHPPDDVAGKLDWAGLTTFTVTSSPVSIDNDAIDWNAFEVNYDGKKR